MTGFFRFLLVSLAFILGTTIVAHAASFDCTKAATETEIAICSDPELSAIDRLMDLLWKKQAQVSKTRLTEQKEWIGKRDECNADLECLKTSYELRLQSENFPYRLSNFKIIEIYDFSIQSLDYYLVTDAFGGAYNMTHRIAKITKKDLVYMSWTVPQFDENYETCNLNNFENNTVKFDESFEVHGWIDLLEQGYADKPVNFGEASVYRKWVGHGDLSDDVTYKLFNGRFVPIEALVDNCSDQRKHHVKTKFEVPIAVAKELNNSLKCSQEDRDYAAYWNNYYDPEVAYKFGETVQQILKRKDLSALLKLIPNEMVSGFRKSDAINAEFGDIISEEVVGNITSSHPECSPVGWRGHMLGNGDLWYSCNKNNCHIVSIHDTETDLRYEKEGFILNGQTLSADCFPYPWLSSDNFQEIADKFEIDIDNKSIWSNFFENTGMFFGDQISEYDISIVRSLEKCGRATEVEIEDGRVSSSDDLSYQVFNSEINSCKELSPNLGFPMVDCRLIFLREETGGSMGSYNTHGIYGVIDLPTIGEAILPLKFFKTKNDALNFVDERK